MLKLILALALAAPSHGIGNLRGDLDNIMGVGLSNLTSTPGDVNSIDLNTTSTYLKGIDVSHYQGTIDWTKVAASGITFAMAKATEGTTYTDPNFATNFKGMKSAGMYRGAYHFARPGSDATTQATYFVSAVNSAGGYSGSKTLQLVLDLEADDGLSPSAVWSWVQTWCAKVKSLTGRSPIIYTGYYFWKDNVGNPTSNLDSPLWIASYTSSPSIPTAWASVGWAFWQYNDNGAISGISGNVDVDYFANSGSYPSISALCFP